MPDSPSAIEGYDSAMVLCGSGLTPEKHMAALRAVGLEDVVRCARSLELHTTYFLKGAKA